MLTVCDRLWVTRQEKDMQRMYGKHFASMYSGSMVGRGAVVFAVMGYVIANMKPDAEVGMQVELNALLLGAILGEQPADIEAAIEFLAGPDPASRSKEEGGRRLVRLGQFDYKVVNGLKYRGIRDERDRREYNRVAQQVHRAKKKRAGGGYPTQAQRETEKMRGDGDERGASRLEHQEDALNEKV